MWFVELIAELTRGITLIWSPFLAIILILLSRACLREFAGWVTHWKWVNRRALRSTSDFGSRRAEAAIRLGKKRDRGAVKLLCEALRKDDDPHVRRAAALALDDIGDPQAADRLCEALQDNDSSVREAVVRALGDLDDPRSVAPLAKALTDEHKEVRTAAAKALEAVGVPQDVAIETWYAVAKGEWESVASLGDGAFGALSEAVRHRDKEVRVAAVKALGATGNREAVVLLSTALEDNGLDVWRREQISQNRVATEVRIAAATELAGMVRLIPEAAEALSKQEGSPDERLHLLSGCEEHDLLDLIQHSIIWAGATGQSIHAVVLSVTNLSRTKLSVVVNSGVRFLSGGGHQNMISTARRRFDLSPLGDAHIEVPAVCADAELRIPGDADTFLGIGPAKPELVRVLKRMEGMDGMTVQAAIWAITDGYSALEVMTRLRDSHTERFAITAEHCIEAKRILDELGILHNLEDRRFPQKSDYLP